MDRASNPDRLITLGCVRHSRADLSLFISYYLYLGRSIPDGKVMPIRTPTRLSRIRELELRNMNSVEGRVYDVGREELELPNDQLAELLKIGGIGIGDGAEIQLALPPIDPLIALPRPGVG